MHIKLHIHVYICTDQKSSMDEYMLKVNEFPHMFSKM